MNRTDLNYTRGNLRSAISVTRGPITCRRSTALIFGIGCVTAGFALAMLGVVIFGHCLGGIAP